MKTFTKSALTIITIAFVMLPRPVSAAESVIGDWEFEFEDKISRDKPFSGSLTIAKNADGSYQGKLSTPSGESPLSDIKFENGNLSFVQTRILAGKEMKKTYIATVQGTKMTGKGVGLSGRYAIEGSLQGQPQTGPDAVVGKWMIVATIPPIIEKVTFFKNADGSLAAKWHDKSTVFKHRVSDVNLADGKLTFAHIIESSAKTYTYFFEGTVKGDTIKGALIRKSEVKETTARRVPPAKPDEPQKSDPNS